MVLNHVLQLYAAFISPSALTSLPGPVCSGAFSQHEAITAVFHAGDATFYDDVRWLLSDSIARYL